MSNDLVEKLKREEQDFEWYPTTQEIIQAVHRDIDDDYPLSVLDIGAGNGKVLMSFGEKDTRYAMEKSQILIESMDKSIFIIGTDFDEQTLIDKKVDLIFCNPPYRLYLQWTKKIITEANSKWIYLVIPERWQSQQAILEAMELREAKYKIVGTFDFDNSEDRKSRAKVDLVKITLREEYGYRNSSLKSDPFEIWFNESFEFDADKVDSSEYEENKKRNEELKSLVKGNNLILRLEELYNKDLQKTIENYRAVEKLDFAILKELDVNKANLKEGLKLKIEGTKNLYWRELFDNLNTITDRLTCKSRESLLGTLLENTSVDFSAKNAYSVVIWAIKNANGYFDKQLVSLYQKISDSKNVRLYKSNNRIIEDGWRYNKSEMSHYSLDYRIVHHFYNAIAKDNYDSTNGLSNSAINLIRDIITIANNLGFDVFDKPEHFQWEAGKPNNFYSKHVDLFAEIKAFKNGNIHFKFMPEFMRKLNVEAARLNGWIKTPQEAADEFDITEKEAVRLFGSNFLLAKSDILLIEE